MTDTTPAARYRLKHPERCAATAAAIEAKTITRASVRFMVGRDDTLLAWLEATYGGKGGTQILQALRDLRAKQQFPPAR